MDLEKFSVYDIAEVGKAMKEIIPAEPKAAYGMLEEYLFRGGKRMRPALLMLCFRSLSGKDKDNAIKAAALVELFHNFSLIHDDIEDDSQFRRGKPTLHITHGIPIALNSGDALYTVVWNWLMALSLPAEKKVKLASILGCSFQRVVEGQGVELGWYKSKQIDVSEKEYFDMVAGKTGALMGASCEAGAYLAGADPKTHEKFRLFGEALGIAFQIQDDILNVVGDFEKYKKEIGGDITEGKRTLMVIHAMAHSTDDEKKKLEQILVSNTRDPKKISYAISHLKKYDSINYAKVKARSFVEQASAFLNELKKSDERDALMKLAEYAINREF